MTLRVRAWLAGGARVLGGMAFDELFLDPRLSEIPRLLDWVEARCRAEGAGGDIGSKVMLALEEAAANAINHGFIGVPEPHRITVRLDITAACVVAEIIDNGRPFDPTGAPEPDLSLPLGQRQPGGLGIHLMRQLMDRLAYRRCNGDNILRLQKKRD